jgi:bifunctional DNase/RNase
VELEAPEEATAGAKVRLSRGGQRIELRAAPSESIALAVAAGVPIVASRRLLDEAGLTREDLARIHGRSGTRAIRL